VKVYLARERVDVRTATAGLIDQNYKDDGTMNNVRQVILISEDVIKSLINLDKKKMVGSNRWVSGL
jgi:hypothetical protein